MATLSLSKHDIEILDSNQVTFELFKSKEYTITKIRCHKERYELSTNQPSILITHISKPIQVTIGKTATAVSLNNKEILYVHNGKATLEFEQETKGILYLITLQSKRLINIIHQINNNYAGLLAPDHQENLLSDYIIQDSALTAHLRTGKGEITTLLNSKELPNRVLLIEMALDNLISKLIVTPKSCMTFISSQASVTLNDVTMGRLAPAIEYIKKNLDKKISIKALAQQVYISISNFYKVFKEVYGLTPNEYILQERIEKAKRLLANFHNINEIAYSTGFSDSNYFIRAFKQIVGITPKKYQKQMVTIAI